jgi:hypothetical protein
MPVFGTTLPAVGPGTGEKNALVNMLSNPSRALPAVGYGMAARSPVLKNILMGRYAAQSPFRGKAGEMLPAAMAAIGAYAPPER